MHATGQISRISPQRPNSLPGPIRHDLVSMHRLMTMSADHDGEPVPFEVLERVVLVALDEGITTAMERELVSLELDEAAEERILERLYEALVIRGADGFMSIVALAFASLTDVMMYEAYDDFPDEALVHQAARLMSLWGLLSIPGAHVHHDGDSTRIYLLNTQW